MNKTKSMDAKSLVLLALLAAVAYVVMAIGRIPVVLFLSYDPKDAIIAISGFMFGPLPALLITVVVALIEMVTVSSTGVIGLIMNVLSTAAFVCPAVLLYQKKKTIRSAVVGLIIGVVTMVAVMLLWNWLITPLYMDASREQIAAMLLPTFLPFNALKGGLNMALTLLLYKPLVTILRRTGMLPASTSPNTTQKKSRVGVFLFALALLATGIVVLLVYNGVL